jgi:WD40 repeat protein
VRLWDPSSGKERRRLEGHTAQVTAVDFSPEGYLLATGGWDESIRLWNIAKGREFRQLIKKTEEKSVSMLFSVAFSPDGKRLAAGGWDQSIQLWDAVQGTLSHLLVGHTDHVLSLAFAPDGRWLASGGKDRQIVLWDLG